MVDFKKRIKKLPKWAQEHILELQRSLYQTQDELKRLELADDVLHSKHWFTLRNLTGEKYLNLFTLTEDGAQKQCSVGKGDIVLIGYEYYKDNDA